MTLSIVDLLAIVDLLLGLGVSVCMLVAAKRRHEWLGGLVLLACVFAAGAVASIGDFIPHSSRLKEPELIPIIVLLVFGFAFALRHRGTTLTALKAVYDNRRFPILVWGLMFISFLPNLCSNRHLWQLFVPVGGDGRDFALLAASREFVECAIEFLGHLFILNWALLFLKDKRKILRARHFSPHEHLLSQLSWVYVDCGTRRNCYRLGDSDFCVKFYKPPEECAPGKMKASIRRDIFWRRFNKFRNSCSREVDLYNHLRHAPSEAVSHALPEICERVYDAKLGWGILETYYTNPDGTAIIPYEWEIRRQKSMANRREIYRLASEMLDQLIESSATFYEPGNLHPQFHADGSISMRIVDFECESKMLIPLEGIWPWYRRRVLRRKANRYLKHIRDTYLAS